MSRMNNDVPGTKELIPRTLELDLRCAVKMTRRKHLNFWHRGKIKNCSNLSKLMIANKFFLQTVQDKKEISI